MASERDEALKEVISDDGPAESSQLKEALSQGEITRQLALNNKHEMDKIHAELGLFGRIFGSESHAAIVIAFVVIVLGFLTSIGLWIAAYFTGKQDFWATEAHLSLSAATSALAYIFGRGSKDSAK
jgi:hypothetical protein